MKQLLALLLAMVLLIAAFPCTLAEEPASATSDEDIRNLDEVDEDAEQEWVPLGATWPEPQLADYDLNSPALYSCIVLAKHSLFAETYKTAADSYGTPRVKDSVGYDYRAEVLAVGQTWAIVRSGKKIGYIKRDFIDQVTPVNNTTTPPYGVQKATYVAVTAAECPVQKSMSDEDENWVVLTPGTVITIWRLMDGWAIVPYWRTFGYINLNLLSNLVPVSPTDDPMYADTPIAAYTSYYTVNDTDLIQGRITNIRVACRRMTGILKPGQVLNFNEDVGPFNKALGYAEAPVLVNGTSKPGYGGGTCQVSSTLYNALLQLPHITIQYRRPHGPSGAKYLPHGVDAAVGGELNLRFRNDYSFPIRIEGHTRDDGALTVLIYKAE